MVTTRSLRLFSLECLHWAANVSTPCARQVIMDAARTWLKIADVIEVRSEGRDLPDLRSKLN